MRHDWPKIIAEIEATGFSLYKIAARMRKQYVQVKRIKVTGRCQHHEGEVLLEIHREVSRETLQNVPESPTMPMQTA